MIVHGRVSPFASLAVVAVVASAGCLGAPQPDPEAHVMEFEDGSGVRQILAYQNTTGPFAIRAVIDVEWSIVYAAFSDGAIHWWNFTDESHATHGLLLEGAAPCSRPLLRMLPNHTLLVACGASVDGYSAEGNLRFAVHFSGNLSDLAVAGEAGLVVGAIASPPALEVREMATGVLRTRIDLPNEPRQVSINSAGDVVGAVSLEDVSFWRLAGGENLTLGPGAGVVPSSGDYVWASTNHFDGPFDVLRAFEAFTDGTPQFAETLEHGHGLSFSLVDKHLYASPRGLDAAFATSFGGYEYSRGQYRPLSDVRNIAYVYDLNGSLVRGGELPGVEVTIALLSDGGFYAVSALRAAVGGSQLWLSYGGPDATPPVLVRHNITE